MELVRTCASSVVRLIAVVGVALRVKLLKFENSSNLPGLFTRMGRNIAISAAFLDRDDRAECELAYLACRALDAFEDLETDHDKCRQGIRSTCDYLLGKVETLPDCSSLSACNYNDGLELKLVIGLPGLKQKLIQLDEDRRTRINDLLEDVSEGMIQGILMNRFSADGRRLYSQQVLSRIAEYVIDLLGIGTNRMIDFDSIGMAIQNANDLRDLDKDADCYAANRSQLLLDSVSPTICMPAILANFDFERISVKRAAVTHLSATTAKFFLRQLDLTVPTAMRYPVLFSALTLFSRRVYNRFVNILASAVVTPARDLLTEKSDRNKPLVSRRYGGQDRFESGIVLEHPDKAQALTLFRSLQLAQAGRSLSRLQTDARTSTQESRNLLLASDFLYSRSLSALAPLGAHTIAEFGDLVVRLSVNAELQQNGHDSCGEVASFYSGIVSKAKGLSARQCRKNEARDRSGSQACHQADLAQ